MTEVIGSTRAVDDAGVSPSPTPKPHVPGEPGIWVLLFGDMLVFTVLFTVYLHQRGIGVILGGLRAVPRQGRAPRVRRRRHDADAQ